jgi:hypothetical protein
LVASPRELILDDLAPGDVLEPREGGIGDTPKIVVTFRLNFFLKMHPGASGNLHTFPLFPSQILHTTPLFLVCIAQFPPPSQQVLALPI